MKKKMANFVSIAYHLGCYIYHTFMMYFYLGLIKFSKFKKNVKRRLIKNG